LGQRSLARPDEKERREQVRIVLVKEQVGMMLTIGGQEIAQPDSENGLGLEDFLERGTALFVQPIQLCEQHAEKRVPRRRFTGLADMGQGVGELFLKARVGPALGKIEISE